MNEIWGKDVDDVKKAQAVNAMADMVEADETARTQIRNLTNSREAVIADGRLISMIQLAAASLKDNAYGELAAKVLEDPQSLEPLAEMLFDLIRKRGRLPIDEIQGMTPQKKDGTRMQST